LYEALEIVVLRNRGISIQLDVTEYLRPTERRGPQPKGTSGIINLRHQICFFFLNNKEISKIIGMSSASFLAG